jgi:hypothetical protein
VDRDDDGRLVLVELEVFDEDVVAVLDVQPPLDAVVEFDPFYILTKVALDEWFFAGGDETEEPAIFLAELEPFEVRLVNRMCSREDDPVDADERPLGDGSGEDHAAGGAGSRGVLDAGEMVALPKVLLPDVFPILLEGERVERFAGGEAEVRLELVERDLVEPPELHALDHGVFSDDDRGDDFARVGGVGLDLDLDIVELEGLEEFLDGPVLLFRRHGLALLDAGQPEVVAFALPHETLTEKI